MYMYVYVCIHVSACICMYMHVYVCIWCICMYFVCICMYFLKWHPQTREPMPRPLNTVSRGGSWRATLRAPLGIWASTFFRPGLRLCRLDLAHPTTRHASRAPGAALSFLTEVSRARTTHYNPAPWPVTAGLVGWRPSSGQRASTATLRNHLLTVIHWCLYIDVYACICMYMYV